MGWDKALDKVKKVGSAPLENLKIALDPNASNEERKKAAAATALGPMAAMAKTVVEDPELMEGAATLLSGKPPAVRDPELETEFVKTGDERAGKIRSELDKSGERRQELTDTAAENLRQKAPAVEQLGTDLVNKVTNVYEQGRSQIPDRGAATVGEYGPRGVSQVDRSAVPQVDVTDRFRGEAYTQGQGADMLKNLGEMLMLQAQGQGPSVAADQFRRANEANLAASLAQQASLRGGFDPAAARQIRQSAADLQAQAARDAASARIQEQLNAQQLLRDTGVAIEDTAAEAGRQSLQQEGFGLDEKGLELQDKGYEVGMATTDAMLKDKALADEFTAGVDVALKEGDFKNQELSEEFKAMVDYTINQVNATTGVLETAYQGNKEALKEDINDFNDLVMEKLKQGLGIEQARHDFEQALIMEGVAEELAEIRARNAARISAVAFDREVKKRQAETAQGAARLGGSIASMFLPGGAAAGMFASGAAGSAAPLPPEYTYTTTPSGYTDVGGTQSPVYGAVNPNTTNYPSVSVRAGIPTKV